VVFVCFLFVVNGPSGRVPHEHGLAKHPVGEHQLAETTVSYGFLKTSFSFASQQKPPQPVSIFERDDKKEGSIF
jgi:hypothetical protein